MTADIQKTLLVIDSRVENAAELVAAAGAGARVLMLDAGQDGIAQITAALTEMGGDVDSLQILSHGRDGALLIGDGLVTAGDLDGTTVWSGLLSADADILLGGCDLAAGDAGARFIERLASLTQADVAASTDTTGAADRGGDWDLEAHVGQIDSDFDIEQAALAMWDGTLALNFSVSVGGTSTLTFADILNAAGGDAGVGFTPNRVDILNNASNGNLYKYANYASYVWGTAGQFSTTGFTNRIYPSMSLQYINNGTGGGTTTSVSIQFSNGFQNKSETIIFNIGGSSGNRAPVAGADSFTVSEDGVNLNLSAHVLLANDTDPDPGNTLTIVPFNTTTSKGSTVWYDPIYGGAITYASGSALNYLSVGETTTETFNYTLTDGFTTSIGTVTLTVQGSNDAPFVSAPIANQTVVAGTSKTLTFPSNTFTDPEGKALTLTAKLADNSPLPSWISFNAATRTFTFTPTEGMNGTSANVSVVATDPGNLSISEGFTISVNLGTAPTAGADSAGALAIGASTTLTQATLVSNDTDPDQGHQAALTVSGASTSSSNISVSYDNATHAVTVQALSTDTTKALAAGETRSETVSYTVRDPNGLTGTGTINVTINGQNDAPQGAGLTQAIGYTEDTAKALTGLSVADVDTGETLTATLTLSNPDAGALSSSGGSYNANTGVFTASGTVAQINTILGNLNFAPATNAHGAVTIAVSIADGGENGAVAATGTLSLTGTAVNDAATANGEINQTLIVDEDTATPLAAIVVGDVDTGDTLTVTMVLSAPAAGALSSSAGGTYNAQIGTYSVSGSVATVNTALAGLVFTPAADSLLGTNIAVVVRDAADTGPTGTIHVQVEAVNDAPVFDTAPAATLALNEGGPATVLSAVAVSDLEGDALTATVTLSNPLSGALSGGAGGSYDAATGVFTVSGDAATVGAALSALTLTLDPDLDTDFTLSYSVADGGQDGVQPAVAVTSVTMTGVNDAPIASNLTQTFAYVEDDATVAAPLAMSVIDVDANEQLTLTVTLSDAAAGSVGGTGILETVAGTYGLTGTVAEINAALASLVFQPAADGETSSSATITIADGGEDGATAQSGVLTFTVTAVNDGPTATGLTQTVTVAEDSGLTAVGPIVAFDADQGDVVTATVTLSDTTAGALTGGGSYDIATGVWTATGTVAQVNAALAALTFSPVADRDQDVTASVVIADGGEDNAVAATGTITFDITPENDAPIASNLTQTIAVTEDGAAAGTPLAMSVSDIDTGETLTLILTVDPTAGSLSATGLSSQGGGFYMMNGSVAALNAALADLAFTPAADVDQDTSIAVSIIDAGAETVSGTLTVEVTAVNDAVTASGIDQALTYVEDDGRFALNTITVADPDTDEQITATLTLSDTAAGALDGGGSYDAQTGVWSVTGTVAEVNAALALAGFTAAANHETDATIAVSISDGGENGAVAVTGTIQLDVSAVNDAPVLAIGTASHTFADGATPVALTGLSLADVDLGETLTVTAVLSNQALGALSSTAGSFDAGTGTWSFTGATAAAEAALAGLTFNPDATNTAAGSVAITVADGGEDGAVAATGTVALDVVATAPFIASSNPADNSNGLSLGASMVLTFSEAITAGTGLLRLILSSSGEIVETFVAGTARAAIAGRTMTIDPTNTLASGVGYYIAMDANAVYDAAGLGNLEMIDPTALNFFSAIVPPPPSGGSGSGGGGGGEEPGGEEPGGEEPGGEEPGGETPGTGVPPIPENTVPGGDAPDTLTGSTVNDIITAGAGDDSVAGGEGDDLVYGGVGNDEVVGGVGNDFVYGGSGDDQVTGGDGDDFVYGGVGDDQVDGGEGDDHVFGGIGDDQVVSGSGDDEVEGGVGNDVVYGNTGADEVYGNADDDSVFGGGGNDLLYGGAGGDMLAGGIGADTLTGGKDDDTLSGGAGADVFVYQAGGFGSDRINDFNFADGDRIAIGGNAITDHTAIDGGWQVIFADGSTIDVITGEAYSASWFI